MKLYEAYMNNGGTFESPTVDGLITKISTYYQDGEFPGLNSIALHEGDEMIQLQGEKVMSVEVQIELAIESNATESVYQAEHEQSLRGAQ